MRSWSPSASEVAKYPFLKRGLEIVKSLSISLENITRDENKIFLEKALERLKCAAKGKPYKISSDAEVEVASYYVALLLASLSSSLVNPLVLQRYATWESKRLYSMLLLEDSEVLVRVANEGFGLDVEEFRVSYDPYVFTFRMPFYNYLKGAVSLVDYPWKLVNRVLHKGYVYLRKRDVARIVSEVFKRRILNSVPQALSAPEDLESLIGEIAEWYGPPPPRRTLDLSSLEGIEDLPESYPPCVKRVLQAALKGESLSHSERFLLASFMLRIGRSVDDVLEIFRRSPDYNERLARYQVEHIAGLRGSKKKYTPYSCSSLRTLGLCVNPDDLCKKVKNPLVYYARSVRKHAKKR